MRTSSLRSLAFACLAGGLLLTTSCGKRENDATPDDITTAEDRSEDNVETAISSEAMQAGPADPATPNSPNLATDAEFRARFGACATRTFSSATNKLTIDFGPTNCLCPDGRYRRGQIIVRFTTDTQRRVAGAVVTRQNYFVNNNQHTATRTFTDTGSGSFTVDVANASIIRANNGGTHSWTASWAFTRTAGYNTPLIVADDVYSVTGSATGTNRKGVGYTTTVQTPLVKRADCFKYYVSGVISITNSNAKTMTLNYGNGTCDNTATVSVNGRTRTITLR